MRFFEKVYSFYIPFVILLQKRVHCSKKKYYFLYQNLEQTRYVSSLCLSYLKRLEKKSYIKQSVLKLKIKTTNTFAKKITAI